jgi:GT2 family glycosyltransferase
VRTARTGVVVLNYKNSDDTLACLDSLERSDDLDLDIVVVDNGPDGPEFAELRSGVGRRGETIASGGNLGYAAGNNIGITRVLDRGCDYVWVLNPDTVVEPQTLPILHEHLATVPECGVVGPRILLSGPLARIWFDGGLIDRAIGATRHLNAGKLAADVEPEVIDVDYVTGASMLVRRSMIEEVGLIPEQYFLYYEETDWCVRAQRAGWRTMVDQHARMIHHKRSSDALPRPYYLYYMTRNRVLFAEDCLGVDGEAALRDLDEHFLAPWRARVAAHEPSLVSAFDEIVDLAKADGRARVTGERSDITNLRLERIGA